MKANLTSDMPTFNDFFPRATAPFTGIVLYCIVFNAQRCNDTLLQTVLQMCCTEHGGYSIVWEQ